MALKATMDLKNGPKGHHRNQEGREVCNGHQKTVKAFIKKSVKDKVNVMKAVKTAKDVKKALNTTPGIQKASSRWPQA